MIQSMSSNVAVQFTYLSNTNITVKNTILNKTFGLSPCGRVVCCLAWGEGLADRVKKQLNKAKVKKFCYVTVSTASFDKAPHPGLAVDIE